MNTVEKYDALQGQSSEALFFECPPPDFRGKEKRGTRVKVRAPHSVNYNGGTIVSGKWYAGYHVPDPILPEGYELVGDGSGSQLNAHPPYRTMWLQEKAKPGATRF